MSAHVLLNFLHELGGGGRGAGKDKVPSIL